MTKEQILAAGFEEERFDNTYSHPLNPKLKFWIENGVCPAVVENENYHGIDVWLDTTEKMKQFLLLTVRV